MENNYFFCYSYKLKLFLKNRNIRYEFAGNNPNSGKPYWGYIKNDILGNCLKDWGKLNNYKNETGYNNYYLKK